MRNFWLTFKIFISSLAVIAFLGIACPQLQAQTLLIGESYYITVEAINSDGTVTAGNTSLGIETMATVNTDGKLSFTLSGVPNNTQFNFLVVTIKDNAGTTVRRSIVPAPAAGTSLNLGVSPITENQTAAFLQVFSDAGTDDPLLAFFGFMLVRSADVTTAEILKMAEFCRKGLKGTDGSGRTDGFEAALRGEGATDAMLASLRTNLITEFSSLTSLYKDSIDQYFSSGSAAELQKRGEAAAGLFEYLVNATTDAGMNPEWLVVGFNAMGAIVVPLIATEIAAGTIRASVEQAMGSTIERGMQKLRADNFLKKYTNALNALGGSAAEISRFTTAVNTLQTTMQQQFESFEQTVMGDDMPDAADITTANSDMNTAMETAFNTFMTNCAATDAEITDLRSRLATALGYSAAQMAALLPASRFKFWNQDGTTQRNWPIMMVVSVRWLSNIITAGGSLGYTRDTLAIPAMMAWRANRTDFVTLFPADSGSQSWAALEGLREDIEIVEFTRYSGFTAGISMEAVQALENTFYDRLDALAALVTGTSDGSTVLTSTIKNALIAVFLSPDF